MSFETLVVDRDGAVARVTINRPDKMNALNHQTLVELAEACDEIAADAALRVVVVTGAGDKAFVAGADIGELLEAAGDAEKAAALAAFGQNVLRKLEELGKPTVAMINGYALGGGCELALACTLRTASTDALMGLPEVGLGIIPGYGGTQRLARIAGPGVAREWILTGDMFTGEEAHRVGVVNRVFPPEELEAGTAKLVDALLSKAPVALSFGMEAVLRGWDMAQHDSEQLEAEYFGRASETQDMKEGMSAFLDKRKADFRGE